MRPYGYTPPANYTQAQNPLLVGVDSLYLGFYGEVRPGLLDWVAGNRGDVTLDGLAFTITPRARGVYRATLDNDHMNISLDNRLPGFSSPSVLVQVKSAFILSSGPVAVFERVWKLVEWICDRAVEGEVVSRADLFADFEWPCGFESSDINKFVTRARSIDTHHPTKRMVKGFSIGGSPLRARIYDKTYEISKSKKEWMYKLWGVGRETTVWRVEFQVRRRRLKQFGVGCFKDLMKNMQAIWDYCAGEWLSMRELIGQNVSRRPLTPFWEMVRQVRFEFTCETPLSRFPLALEQGQTPQQSIRQIAGLVRGYSRHNQVSDPLAVLESWLPHIRQALKVWSHRNQTN